jgi:hypothetical protein
MVVVMANVIGEDSLEVTASEHQDAVEALATERSDHRSQIALARGARTGVFTILIPSVRKTSSKVRGNLPSRSRIKNLTGVARSDVETPEQHRVDAEEVARHHALGLGTE